MITGDNSNHLHIIHMGCCRFHKEICSLIFFFKCISFLAHFYFFTVGTDMGARKNFLSFHLYYREKLQLKKEDKWKRPLGHGEAIGLGGECGEQER